MTLILAIVFIVIGALAITGLVSFSGSALLNTATLTSQRQVEYAADSATEIAIQAVRYRPNFYPALKNCLTPTPTRSQSVSIDTRTIVVKCKGITTSAAPVPGTGTIPGSTLHRANSSTLFTIPGTGSAPTYKGWEITDTTGGAGKIPPTTAITTVNLAQHYVKMSNAATGSAAADHFTLIPPHERIVTFYTCLADVASTCATKPIVTAIVDFNDSSSSGHNCTASSSQSCGSSMAIAEWIEHYANH